VKPINQNLRCNEQIRITPVRVIGENNEQLGVLPTYEAMKMARESGLDLVEVAPTVRPPVCRLMDYGKWKYAQKKNIKKHHEQQLKEVRLRPKTDTNDRKIKIRNAISFLKDGHKVQFTMVFRGREQYHREIGMGIFHSIIQFFGPRVKIERPPGMEGRHMIMILSAAKGALDDLGRDTDSPPPAKPAEVPAAISAPPVSSVPIRNVEPPPAPASAPAEPVPADVSQPAL
jgi:translation initiation factor IF-3